MKQEKELKSVCMFCGQGDGRNPEEFFYAVPSDKDDKTDVIEVLTSQVPCKACTALMNADNMYTLMEAIDAPLFGEFQEPASEYDGVKLYLTGENMLVPKSILKDFYKLDENKRKLIVPFGTIEKVIATIKYCTEHYNKNEEGGT